MQKGVMTVAKSVVNTAVAVVNSILDPISNANNAGMAKGEIKAEYTRAANEGVKELAVASVLGAGVGKVVTKSAAGILKGETGSLGNPFKGKTMQQVQKGFEKQVKDGKLEPKYTDPVSGSRSYKNTESGYSYNLDQGVSGKTGLQVEKPHVDVNYPNPKPVNVPPKKKLDIE